MSPWRSDKQRRWGNSPAGIAAMGAAKVHEFNEASKGMALPGSAKHAAARIHAIKKKGGKAEDHAQRRAMSKTKRGVRMRKRGALAAHVAGY